MSDKSMVSKKRNTVNLRKFFLAFLAVFLVLGIFWIIKENKRVVLHYYDDQARQKILILPLKEKKKLENFMQKLFAEDSFAYTLLGDKPLSWETYLDPFPYTNWSNFYHSFSEHDRILRAGWKTFEKYKHLFCSTLFFVEKPKCHPGIVAILLINQKHFNRVVLQNQKDFQEILSCENVDGDKLIKEAKNHSLINEVLKGHQALIGTVLGYGRNNSWKFLESCKNRIPITCVWEEDNIVGSRLEKECKLTDYYLDLYSCPSFAGEPHSEESQALKAKYLVTKQIVLEYYQNKDFLEATLSLLAGYLP